MQNVSSNLGAWSFSRSGVRSSSTRARSSKPFLARLIPSLASLAAAAYTQTASAAWVDCHAIEFFEHSLRQFTVVCANSSESGVPRLVQFLANAPTAAERDAQAQRYQDVVMTAILSGRMFRINTAPPAGTLCNGQNDCSGVSQWGVR